MIRKAPVTAAVIEDPQPVAPMQAPAPPTVTPEAETKSEVLSASPTPTAVTTSIVPPAPISRRARKVHQRRLQQAAHRQACEKSL